jgi:hypothetical protein
MFVNVLGTHASDVCRIEYYDSRNDKWQHIIMIIGMTTYKWQQRNRGLYYPPSLTREVIFTEIVFIRRVIATWGYNFGWSCVRFGMHCVRCGWRVRQDCTKYKHALLADNGTVRVPSRGGKPCKRRLYHIYAIGLYRRKHTSRDRHREPNTCLEVISIEIVFTCIPIEPSEYVKCFVVYHSCMSISRTRDQGVGVPGPEIVPSSQREMKLIKIVHSRISIISTKYIHALKIW